MPYTAETAPDFVKKFPKGKRDQWVAVWNDVYSKCMAKDGAEKAKCEAQAFGLASGVVKKSKKRSALTDIWAEIKDLFEAAIEEEGGAPPEEEEEPEERADERRGLDLRQLNAKLYEAVPEGYYPLQLYFTPGNKIEGVFTHAGKLYRSFVGVEETGVKLGAMEEVAYQFVPISTEGLLAVKARAVDMAQVKMAACAAAGDGLEVEKFLISPGGDAYGDVKMHVLASDECGGDYRAAVEVTDLDQVIVGEWEKVKAVYMPVYGFYPEPAEGEDEPVAAMTDMGDEPPEPEDEMALTRRPGINVFRQEDGRYRWVAISCTAVLNKAGEIDSTELFDNMIKRAAKTGDYPYYTFYHLGRKFLMGRADFLARDGWLYITSGLHEPGNKLAEAAIRATTGPNRREWGHSIKYLPVGLPEIIMVNGSAIPVYRDGVNIEVSLLPNARACSYGTDVQTQEDGVNDKVREALVKMLGDNADEFIRLAETTNRAIEDEKMIARATGTPAEETAAPPAELERADEDTTDAEAEEVVSEEVGAEEDVERHDDDESAEDAEDGEWELVLEDEVVDELVGHVAARMKPDFEALEAKVERQFKALNEVERDSGQHDVVVSAVLQKFMARLEALERSDEDKKRAWLKDVPGASKQAETIRPTYRPKNGGGSVAVAAPVKARDSGENFADIAANTLANL